MSTPANAHQIFEGGERVLFRSLVAIGVLFLVLLAVPFLFDNEPAGNALAEDAVREVKVVLTEFTIEPTSLSFEAGDHVKFVVENRGSVAQEFRLTTRSGAEAHVDEGHQGHTESGGEDEDGIGWLVVYPRQTETLEVVFDEHSVFDMVACLLPGHYEQGMSSPLTIAGVMAPEMDTDHDMDDGHVDDPGMEDDAHDHERDDDAVDDGAVDDGHMDDGAMDDEEDESHDHGTDDDG